MGKVIRTVWQIPYPVTNEKLKIAEMDLLCSRWHWDGFCPAKNTKKRKKLLQTDEILCMLKDRVNAVFTERKKGI